MTASLSTVAVSLRTIQQGINEAMIADVNLAAAVEDKLATLKDHLIEGSQVSLEKMQKGKDDAWTLIYGGIQRHTASDDT